MYEGQLHEKSIKRIKSVWAYSPVFNMSKNTCDDI